MAWWIWVVLGTGLLVLELVTGLFVAIWFGASALLVGALTLLVDLSLPVQILCGTAIAVLLTWGWFAIIKPRYLKTRTFAGRASAGIIGEIGLATTDIQPFKPGIVRFSKPICGSDCWECFSDDTVMTGSRVRIVAIEGNAFKVALIRH